MGDSCGDGFATDVKRHELELLDGQPPLTFCAGTVIRTWVPGCGRVFEDTTIASGGGRSYWLRWCDECKPKPRERMLPLHVRDAIRASL